MSTDGGKKSIFLQHPVSVLFTQMIRTAPPPIQPEYKSSLSKTRVVTLIIVRRLLERAALRSPLCLQRDPPGVSPVAR